MQRIDLKPGALQTLNWFPTMVVNDACQDGQGQDSQQGEGDGEGELQNVAALVRALPHQGRLLDQALIELVDCYHLKSSIRSNLVDCFYPDGCLKEKT